MLALRCSARHRWQARSSAWRHGLKGSAEPHLDAKSANFRPLYDTELPIREKIATIAAKVYGANGVDYSPAAEKSMAWLEQHGMGNTPVCMAKTQYSLSDDASKLGVPTNFRMTVQDVSGSAGAGFVVAKCGDIMTMPGLSKSPAAERMKLRPDGTIEGLS